MILFQPSEGGVCHKRSLILHDTAYCNCGKEPLFLASLFLTCLLQDLQKNGRDMCQSLNSGLGIVHKYISEEVQS